jgi:diguanylate cyclase (GGDEF)-like protein
VYAGDEVAAYTMWLAPGAFPTAGMRSRHEALLGHLRAAAAEDHERELEEAKLAAARAAARAAEAADRDASRPDIVGGDLLGSLPDREHLDLMISELETDQAAVLVLGLDNADDLATVYGAEGMEQVRQIVAQRLVSSVRKHDMIAYVGDDAFAVVLVNVDRHTAFEVSRRLRGTLSTPLAADLGETVLSVSVGLSHESGLIDAADMFEAASSAMADARDEGGARMLIAC